DEVRLGGPAAVDRRLAHAGAPRDLLHRELLEALLGQQLERRDDDRLVGALGPRPPGRAARGLGLGAVAHAASGSGASATGAAARAGSATRASTAPATAIAAPTSTA